MDPSCDATSEALERGSRRLSSRNFTFQPVSTCRCVRRLSVYERRWYDPHRAGFAGNLRPLAEVAVDDREVKVDEESSYRDQRVNSAGRVGG